MKLVLRWAFRLLLIVMILLAAAILLLDTMARRVAEREIRKRTGLPTTIGALHIGLRQPEVAIENLTVYNSTEFGGTRFIEIPEFYIAYDRDALRAHQLHCSLVRFNLAQLNVVEGKRGSNNVEALLQKLQQIAPLTAFANGTNQTATNRPFATAKNRFEFTGMDALELTLGTATYRSLQRPGPALELKMKVNQQKFTNVRSGDDLSGVLFVALLRSGVTLVPSGDRTNWLQWFSPVKPGEGR